VWFVLVLLVLNFSSVLLVRPAGQPRVKVPFSPYFVSAVQAGRVASIASKGDTVQGTFRVAVRYPAAGPQAQLTKLFSTEVPTFWNDNQLTALLQSQ
jgi:cell division protease FtsH